ncbi:hypothetical protein CS8_022750 [Cupriavidus sp. 8B]
MEGRLIRIASMDGMHTTLNAMPLMPTHVRGLDAEFFRRRRLSETQWNEAPDSLPEFDLALPFSRVVLAGRNLDGARNDEIRRTCR